VAARALDELDRVRAAGATSGGVLADAEYGKAAEFRHGLSARGLLRAVGSLPTQKVYPAGVTVAPPPVRATGRPATPPVPSARSEGAKELLAAPPATAWRTIAWRRGTKGGLRAEFAALRGRVADGPVAARAQHLPGDDEAWLVCGRRATGERKYYLTSHPAEAALETLAAAIEARWVCEQAHQQLKGELGLDRFEGRSWTGPHHHALLLCLIALCFLQHLRLRRLGGKSRVRRTGTAARAVPAAGAAPSGRGPELLPAPLSPLPPPRPLSPPPLNVAE
jgi:SRSO17 transposase